MYLDDVNVDERCAKLRDMISMHRGLTDALLSRKAIFWRRRWGDMRLIVST